ncbi:MAG: UPF0147 family protein [Candidatus Nanoarchaeia archaeon]|nr:UPF0147 family protein [Candidatus Nanoarchaeia archaeon]
MASEKIDEAVEILDELYNDKTIPKNIKALITNVKQELQSNKDKDIKIDSALLIIDSIANDTNLPVYARTQVWKAVSILESEE